MQSPYWFLPWIFFVMAAIAWVPNLFLHQWQGRCFSDAATTLNRNSLSTQARSRRKFLQAVGCKHSLIYKYIIWIGVHCQTNSQSKINQFRQNVNKKLNVQCLGKEIHSAVESKFMHCCTQWQFFYGHSFYVFKRQYLLRQDNANQLSTAVRVLFKLTDQDSRPLLLHMHTGNLLYLFWH